MVAYLHVLAEDRQDAANGTSTARDVAAARRAEAELQDAERDAWATSRPARR